MTNDKLDLQECLEHGRTAKVRVLPTVACAWTLGKMDLMGNLPIMSRSREHIESVVHP